MGNILNLDAETGANIIGDDAQPTLEISNSSTGVALNLKATGAAALKINTSILAANATILNGGLELVGASVASGAMIKLINRTSYISVSTIMFTTAVAANVGAIRVVRPDGTFGWIPVMPDAAVTAIAV